MIGWNLCPWAAKAWEGGEVRSQVFLETAPEISTVSTFVDELTGMEEIAIGLAIFPRAAITVTAWERFAERVRRAGGPFLIAAFHPAYRTPLEIPSSAGELVTFLRRTPDPTLQLVRANRVEDLSRGRDLSTEIARDNFARVNARGVSALEAVLADICRDRAATYARLDPG